MTAVISDVAQVPVPSQSARPRIPATTLRPVSRLAVLGDSTAVGLGDPLPGGGWRGVGPLVAAALGVASADFYHNGAFTGARMRCVRTEQLPAAVRMRPDVTLLVVGMNDTLRSDFDPAQLVEDLGAVVTALHDAGSLVLALRFHDHSRVFRLPGPLARALRARIGELNRVIDLVAERYDVPCLDVREVSGSYELAAWSVDRLHPSELGHRMLARGFTELVAGAGFAVAEPVSLECGGGLHTGAVEHIGWLVVQGVPWLLRRGRDFLPHAGAMMARSALRLPLSTLTRARSEA
ncbi:MAG: SGNH/GDSL hydrolase family protein [Haloechinothrix sp.]